MKHLWKGAAGRGQEVFPSGDHWEGTMDISPFDGGRCEPSGRLTLEQTGQVVVQCLPFVNGARWTRGHGMRNTKMTVLCSLTKGTGGR